MRPLHGKGGRNAHGRITTRHKGGGHKRAYRVIDFRRHDKDGVDAKVAHIEYDPNRTANIALLHYLDGEKRYIIAPQGLSQGTVDRVGRRTPTSSPATTCRCATSRPAPSIHAVELRPGGGAKMARSAGVSIQLLGKEGTYATLRMPSGEIRRVDVRCRATVGEVGNAEQAQHQLGQGRPHAVEGQAPHRPWCRDEPGRPPARWWRGQDLRWSPPGRARGASPRAAPASPTSRATSSSSDAGAPARISARE